MKRLLIVDDNVDVIQRYFWHLFERLLPLDKLEIVHAPMPSEAVEFMNEPWDVILMDHRLGPGVTILLGEAGSIKIRDGQDLTRLRRAIEARKGLPKAYIIGIAESTIGNTRLLGAGANTGLLKLHVPQIAELIRRETKLT